MLKNYKKQLKIEEKMKIATVMLMKNERYNLALDVFDIFYSQNPYKNHEEKLNNPESVQFDRFPNVLLWRLYIVARH